MTKREKIIAALHNHYVGKEFTSKDVAAYVGAHRDYTSLVLQDIRGVKLIREDPCISPRGGALKQKKKVYTFQPVSNWTA